MRSMSIIMLLAIAGSWHIAIAEPAQIPYIKVLQDRGSSITIEFRLNGYDVQPVQINENIFSRIALPGQVTYLEKGMPELPYIARNIIIPDNGQMDYRIVSAEYKTVMVDPVMPSKGNLYRNIDPEDIPYTFDRFYQSDAWWPYHTIELTEPFILRDYRGITVKFNPFQFNPVTNELKVATRVVVEVYESGKDGVNILHRENNTITREFIDIYDNIFLNFNQARYDSVSEAAGRMVIICADAYMSNMQDFKTWKRMKGIDTKLVPISSIGNNQTNIKTFIQNEYSAGDLVWVLLVGDGNEVVPATGTVGSANGADADPVYAYTSGTDYYPDIFVSRFSSRGGSSANIDKQVSRSIGYEKTPQTGASWYHVGLGVASNEGSPPDYERCNWLRDSLLDYYYTEVKDQYQGQGGSTSGITTDIEDGLSIINYIGHGSQSGWASVSYTISNVTALNNPWMLPFVISVACLVGDFNGGDCFCEASVVAGTVTEPDGFLVHWGSTISQSWVPPCIGQEGAVNLLTHNKKNTAGGIFFNGASYMIEYYSGGNEGVEMAQTWCIFGDASIQLRTNTPAAMTVNHAGSINIGQTTFDVNVPGVQSALVGLYIDTLLVGHGYTNAAGNVTITLSPPPSGPGTMYITVTAYNRIPYLGSVPITSSSGPYMVMGLNILNDSGGNGQANPGETIDLGIYGKNVGTSTAFGVYGLLFESDPYISLTIDSSWYGNIPAGDSSLSSPYYHFAIANNCPNEYTASFDLEFHDNNDSTWMSHPGITVYAPILTYQDNAIVGGNGNGILDPGETCDVVVTIENEGGAVAQNVTSTLLCASPYITINDATGNYGTINPGNQANNSADPYNVTASGTTPTGTTVNFQVVLVSGVYCDTVGFSIVVGRKHYYLWNPDETPTPGQNCHAILGTLGYVGDYGTSLAPDLSLYQAVLVCVGIYASNYVIPDGGAEATALTNFCQTMNGRVYLEGGDVWYYDPLIGGHDFCSLFGINATGDGSSDMGPVQGQSGTFTNGMYFTYGGENYYMDHISATGTGFLIFRDVTPGYDCGVANDASTYRTVGTSFELGLLTDGTGVSTRAALLDSIMKFFGIIIPGVEEAEGLTGLPLKTQLSALYPNPGVRQMQVAYQLAQPTGVQLVVYDAAGRLVRTLCDAVQEPGYYAVRWNGCDDAGRAVSAGVYFVRFETDTYEKTEKAILLR